MTNHLKTFFLILGLSFGVMGLSACSPEIGSKEWCLDMKEKPKGDWSANEAAEFAKNCVF
jgi:hypothetical protein